MCASGKYNESQTTASDSPTSLVLPLQSEVAYRLNLNMEEPKLAAAEPELPSACPWRCLGNGPVAEPPAAQAARCRTHCRGTATGRQLGLGSKQRVRQWTTGISGLASGTRWWLIPPRGGRHGVVSAPPGRHQLGSLLHVGLRWRCRGSLLHVTEVVPRLDYESPETREIPETSENPTH